MESILRNGFTCGMCGALVPNNIAHGCIPAPQHMPWQTGKIELPPKGCICPPTSEKTCERWDCGRKDALNFRPGVDHPVAPERDPAPEAMKKENEDDDVA
jgi:hypothetical protein